MLYICRCTPLSLSVRSICHDLSLVWGWKNQGVLDSHKSRHAMHCLHSRNPSAAAVEFQAQKKIKRGSVYCNTVYHFDTAGEAQINHEIRNVILCTLSDFWLRKCLAQVQTTESLILVCRGQISFSNLSGGTVRQRRDAGFAYIY